MCRAGRRLCTRCCCWGLGRTKTEGSKPGRRAPEGDMGLAISVGVLAEVSDDREGAKFERRRFKHLNKWLRRAGLPKHAEPKDMSEVLSYDGFGYTGLHCLRRFAATIWARNEWPLPLESGEQAANDPALKQLSLTCDWSLGKNGFRMFRSP